MKEKIARFFLSVIGIVAPPHQWRLPVIITLGIMTGLGALIFRISNASSYLSDKPETCMNCHVMTPQFATWQRGSHGRVATCNDCHVPHDNIVNTYLFKAQDGTRHAYVFTLRLEPQVIQIKDAGKAAVQQNCLRCHDHLTSLARLGTVSFAEARHGEGTVCWDCHRDVPHGRVSSLASTPYARVPMLSSVVPAWIDSLVQTERRPQ